MLEREMLMHMIAYNLIRAMMLDAAANSGKEPVQGSFSAGVACARDITRILAASTNRGTVARRLLSFKAEFLAKTTGPRRRGRAEPRAIKRGRKSFPKMNKARHDYPQHQRKAA